ncbi:MAG: O-antigen ligase family protein [Acidobacteriota bacterium]|nr:O-antigen ligase family protein [Acidobacteriota bacterium]
MGAAGVVGALLSSNGGFFPVSWSWASLALLWVGALALVLRAPFRPTRIERAFLGALVLLVAWVWISIAWTSDVTQSVFEGERSLMLVAAVGAGLALAQRRPVRPLLGGTLAGIVVACGYALATRLLPGHVGHFDPVAVYRLNTPVGYWNGLGIVAALGAVLALGFSLRARATTSRALAALALPVLLLTLYFTYSRGAWVALAAGLVVLLALDPNRLATAAGLAALAPAPALVVYLASRSGALTRQNSTLAAARHDGHRIALVLLAVALAEAAVALGLRAAGRFAIPHALRLGFAALLVAAVLGAAGGALAHYGSPARIAHRVYHDFTAPPPKNVVNLNTRVFNLSNDGRIALWKVAWHEADANLLLGGGAGTYQRYYLQHRVTAQNVEDAHSLYLETLAELGVAGLVLLVAVLAIPLAAAVRFRRHRLVPFAAAAYSAYLVHAAIDWDWELAGVTLAALLCGLACVLAGRADGAPALGARPRGVAAALAVGLSALTLVGLLGNTALESSQAAAARGNWRAAESHARTAIRFMPWSAAGWQALGEAQLGLHDKAGARRSLGRAAAKDPRNWVVWLDLIGASTGKAQVAAVNRAYRLDPLDPALVPYLAVLAGG